MNIFKKATMACKRILEYDAMMATPEWKKWLNAENDKYRAARFYKTMLR